MKKLINAVKNFIRIKPKLSIILLLLFLAVFTFINVEVLHYTSEPGFCEMCHPGTGTEALSEVHTWRQNIHAEAGIKCLDCHGKPGAYGYMRAKIGGLYDTYAEVFHSQEFKLDVLNKSVNDPEYAAKLVPSSTCLFCHTDEVNQKTRDETIMSVGLKFRTLDGIKNPEFRQERGLRDLFTEEPKGEIDPQHQTHYQAGLDCMECHHRFVHGGPEQPKADLNRCSECHSERKGEIKMSDITLGEGGTAAKFSHDFHGMMFDCKQCHTGLFPMKAGVSEITFADHSSDKACYSCHNGQAASFDCASCHGQVPMPQEPITYEGGGLGKVTFNHSFHGAAFSCDKCHEQPWKMEAHATKMTMNPMYQGESCGTCHNGELGFAVTECARCHQQ